MGPRSARMMAGHGLRLALIYHGSVLSYSDWMGLSRQLAFIKWYLKEDTY